MLDCGMSPTQRELVSAEVTVVPAPDDSQPFLLKTIAPLRHPAEVMVLIDADMIVTRSLADLIERASEGRAVAVEDRLDRFFPEWGELLGLGTAHRRPYISSSLVFLGGDFGRRVITDVGEALSRIDMMGTAYSGPNAGSISAWHLRNRRDGAPLVLCGPRRNQRGSLRGGCTRAAPDARRSPDGRDSVHWGQRPRRNPAVRLRRWHRAVCPAPRLPGEARHEPTIPGVYSQLLTRLLHGEDVAVRMPTASYRLTCSRAFWRARNWRRGGLSARARAFRDRFRREVSSP